MLEFLLKGIVGFFSTLLALPMTLYLIFFGKWS